MSDPLWPDPTGPTPVAEPLGGLTPPAPIGDATHAATQSATAQPEFELANYGVPQYSWATAAYGQPDPYDPLVTAPGQAFEGWWARLWHTARRSWRPVLGIAALTNILPSVLLAVGLTLSQARLSTDPTATDDQVQSNLSPAFEILAVVLLIAVVVMLVLTAVGWAAIVWVVTRQAAGQPAPFGHAFAYGLRNCVRLIGWQLLVGVIILAGLVACVLPGLYFAIVLSLVMPAAVFERGTSAVSRSWRMVKDNFGAVLGRILLLFLAELALVVLADGVAALIEMAGGGVAMSVVVAIMRAIIDLPAQGLLIIGTILTYAEMRARERPTYTGMLLTELHPLDQRGFATVPAG